MALWALGLLGVAGAARGQALRGSFFTVERERGFSSRLFRFVNARFAYCSSSCTGTVTGEGVYRIEGDRLTLIFHKAAADTIQRARPVACVPTSPPAFQLRVIDHQSRQPLPGVTVRSKLMPHGSSTGPDGTASFTYNPPRNDEVVVETIGYSPVQIPLRHFTSQSFIVQLGPPYYFEAGDTLVFQLKRATQKELVLRPVLDLAAIDDDALPYEHLERVAPEKTRKYLKQP